MDAICVLLVSPSWAGETCAAPCAGLVGPPLVGAFGALSRCGEITKGMARRSDLQGTPWWAAKHQPLACALSAGNTLKTENCFQPQEK